ncbi:MAG: DegV family protein [Bacillota bacterium]
MIKIVTDSVSDIPPQLVRDLDITVLPLTVNFRDKSYKDDVELSSSAFFQMIKTENILPTTSQVAPAAFLETFDSLTKDGSTVIAILMSSALSGTYNSAVTAKEMLIDRDIEVVDSQGVTLGYGLLVIEAARMVQANHTKEQIVDKILYMRDNMEYKFVVDTLEHLYKGGRLSASSAFMGKLLNIKPILKLKDGKLVLEDKVRGRKKAIKWVIDWIKEQKIDLSNQTIGINHSNDEEYVHEFITSIRENFQVKEIIVSETGCVVGTHAGPGAIAIYFLHENK